MKLPAAFLDLHAAGRFDYWGGARYHDLDQATRERLAVERRGSVLWLRGIEWDVAPSEVREQETLRPGLYVFAGNGGGDSYAFYPAWQGAAPEPPVLFVPHDESTARVYAPCFATMLFRLWLTQAVDWDSYDGNDRESALRAWAAIIAPTLDEATGRKLQDLAGDLEVPRLREALDAFVAALPGEQLVATLPPTRYNPKYVKGAQAKRLYDESVRVYEQLVAEGHARFTKELEEARRNREAALQKGR